MNFYYEKKVYKKYKGMWWLKVSPCTREGYTTNIKFTTTTTTCTDVPWIGDGYGTTRNTN
jgi:hypothetical protein